MRNITKGLVIAGTHSGCGKTTVTLGILAALKKKDLKVQSFKTGPDFIDAGLHKLIIGRPSRNLDLWMCGEDYVRDCFQKFSADADISVVEGVMGLYDGKFSTAHLASALNLPVLLVVDAYGIAESAGAVVRGFTEYSAEAGKRGSGKEDFRTSELPNFRTEFAGVIFNRVASENHFKRLKDSVLDVPVLGYLPRDLDFEIPHRHLGLTVAEEEPITAENIDKLSDTVLKYVDVDEIVRKSKSGEAGKRGSTEEQRLLPDFPTSELPSFRTSTLKVAVAYDKAFCFYYEDNLDLLKAAGVQVLLFSPLTDKKFPDDTDAIYIGGGYPELYAKQLSENRAMLESVRSWADEGKPVYAECGGFMYLTEGIYDFGDLFYPMAGAFPLKTKMTKGRVKLGYREVTLKHDSILGAKGASLRGHEFHYSEVINSDQRSAVSGQQLIYSVKDGSGNIIQNEGYSIKNTLGSYIHIHFGSNYSTAENFIKFCMGALWK
ncbi:MAG: cobyrinate a,c-diamide synthase [Nitrospirae bacterium]|nr:cobyrinate a,c-diamide synthase [Nitrospirota bacterium]